MVNTGRILGMECAHPRTQRHSRCVEFRTFLRPRMDALHSGCYLRFLPTTFNRTREGGLRSQDQEKRADRLEPVPAAHFWGHLIAHFVEHFVGMAGFRLSV